MQRPETFNAYSGRVFPAAEALAGMLGASHPMEAHRLDSRAMFHRGRSADAREGIASFLEKRGAHFSDSVSRDLPELPWGDEPQYR